MTDTGQHIIIEAGEVPLDEMLETVQKHGRTVRICRNGQAIAQLSPVPGERTPPQDPQLKVVFAPDYDPQAGLSDNDWPSELR
jgi:hypothetical protein